MRRYEPGLLVATPKSGLGFHDHVLETDEGEHVPAGYTNNNQPQGKQVGIVIANVLGRNDSRAIYVLTASRAGWIKWFPNNSDSAELIQLMHDYD